MRGGGETARLNVVGRLLDTSTHTGSSREVIHIGQAELNRPPTIGDASSMPTITEVRSQLQSRDHLLASGHSDHQISQRVRAGELVQVRRGQFMASDDWGKHRFEAQHLAQVVAAQATPALRNSVFSHTAAAAVHGLPLISNRPKLLHLTGAPHSRPAPGLMRHTDALSDDDIVEVGGIRVTSLERTAYDLARTLDLAGAMAAVDAVLARVGGDPRDFDAGTAETVRERLGARAAASDRGVRQARFVFGFADGRASSAIESLGRLRAYEAGFREFRLQVPVPAPRGGLFWVDLRLEEVSLWMEFDGFVKLSDSQMLGALTPAEAARAEKEREDWIRGTTGDRLVHFGWDDVRSTHAFLERMQAFHVPLP